MNTQDHTATRAILEPLLSDPEVVEIMVDGHNRVYVEKGGEFVDVPSPFRDDVHLMDVIDSILEPLGHKVDESHPIVDARLPDGSRVNVVIPPISLTGPSLTIRKLSQRPLTIEALIRFNSLSADVVEFIKACVRSRLNIVVAGGTGSGKTTLLNIISEFIPGDERIIVIQNIDELQIRHNRVVKLGVRPPDFEGRGAVTMHELVANALRMRPDRIIAGDVQSGEALDLFQAINTGHDGTMITMHAGSPRDALARLETMVTMANLAMPLLTVRQQMTSAIDLIIYQERLGDGSRKVVKVTEVAGIQGDVVMLKDIFEFRQTGKKDGRIVGKFTATGYIPKFLDRITAAGIHLPMGLFTSL